MTHRVLAVDSRINQSGRGALVRECLHEGYELFIPDTFDTETLLREARGARAIITSFAPVTEEMMKAAPELCVIGRGGTGVDMIDISAATALKIPVLNSPGHMRSDPIAEHVLTMMLMLSRRPWLWGLGRTTIQHNAMMGATAGIVGLGNIGRGVAKRCAPFGMEIIAHTRTRGKFRPEGFEVEECASLEELLPRADYLLLSLPLSEESEGLIGAREIGLMKKSAFLINVSRGAIVDTAALTDALEGEKLGGAGLDVTEPEPLPEGHPLLGMANVLISPHSATHAAGVQRRSTQLMCDNIRRAVEGERPTSFVNPEIYG